MFANQTHRTAKKDKPKPKNQKRSIPLSLS